MPEVSVIIIGRNEVARIERCLRSVFASIPPSLECEVIYVDSASTDGTVEIASRFPIRILQLQRKWKLSPAAGRYIGYQHARGDYLLFVDGDTILAEGWLAAAYTFLNSNSGCGGVGGIMDQAYESPDGSVIGVARNFLNFQGKEPQNVRSLPGIAMYRRATMEQVGTFNPYLPTGEESELALRIRQAGWSLIRINEPMCVTLSMPRESLSEILRRSRSHLYDYGTTLRYCLTNGCGLRFSIEQMSFVWSFVGALAAFIAAIVAAWWISSIWFVAVAVAGSLLFLAVKRRPPRQLGISLLKRTLMTYRTLQSFVSTRIASIDAYPTDVVVVK